MPSLIDAIEIKYGEDGKDSEAPIGIYVPRLGPRKSIPRLLVLDNLEISSAGEESYLIEKVSNVIELDVSYNAFSDWEEILKILKNFSSLQFLNLSFNPLSSPLSFHQGLTSEYELSNLHTLILIGTNICWSSVWTLLSLTTNLKELHLSKNNFSSIEVPESSILLPSVEKIMLNATPLKTWREVMKIGKTFPALTHLGLADCQIDSIPPDAYESFLNLKILSLSSNPIKTIEDIMSLNLFPSLTQLRIQGTQLFSQFTDHERRFFLIALLPKVEKINGGATIQFNEREDAERAVIRYYNEHENEEKPQRFYELRDIHGDLLPLVDINLKPATKVKLLFFFEKVTLEKEISVYLSTYQLKVFLGSVFEIKPNDQRLFYIDAGLREAFGREEMRFNNKQIYSYNMKDGDEIHVELRRRK